MKKIYILIAISVLFVIFFFAYKFFGMRNTLIYGISILGGGIGGEWVRRKLEKNKKSARTQ